MNRSPRSKAASAPRGPSAAVDAPRSELRVRFAETDAQGIVYHAAYLLYFEVARYDWLAWLLCSAAHATTLWQRLVIASVACDYRMAARFGDILSVRVSDATLGNSSFVLDYLVTNESADVVATGETTLVYIGGRGAPSRLPRRLRARIVQTTKGTQPLDSSTSPTLMHTKEPTHE